MLPPLFVLVGIVGLMIVQVIEKDKLSAHENRDSKSWLAKYWQTPIPLQGPVPPTHHPLAQGIHPKDCSNCHPDKFKDWSASLHGNAMGPGILAQYASFNSSEKAECNICHAPLSEQWQEIKNEGGEWQHNFHFQPDLENQGVSCAACHLREHKRHGPPLTIDKESLSEALHGVPERTPIFESSEFCRGCHQHGADSLHINGKPIENTYNEWLQSPAFKEGKTCQTCHMPERRHLWKGIHDQEMTAAGVTISHSQSSSQPRIGEKFAATLSIRNTGTGHHFPTYTTPAIVLKAAFLDETGKVVAKEYYQEKIIQRRLDMSTDPWTEEFDTRLAPGQEISLSFDQIVPLKARMFKLWVWVEPDQFYEGFYQSMLENKPPDPVMKEYNIAMDAARNNQYVLFNFELEVHSQ